MTKNAYQTIQQTLQKIRYLFILTGMKLHEKRPPGISPIKYKATYIFNFAWFFLASLGTLSYLCTGITEKSFTELSFIAPCLTFGFLATAKTVCYTMYDTEAFKIIEDLIKLDVNRKDTSHMEIVNEIKFTETNFLKKILNVLNVMYILLLTLYNSGPLVATAVIYFSTEEIKLFLPYLDVYPFDALDLRYWPYAYIHQAWSVCLVLFYVGSVDCFLLTCCSYIRIQFRLMQVDVENIIPAEDMSHENINIDIKIKELVCRHQEIIRLSSSLQNMFSLSILVNVLISSTVICLTGFNVTVIKELAMVIPSLVFLVTSLLQVCCLCYFGDLLMRSSEEVSDAVYASKWYLADKSTAKKLLFFLTRSQTPCKLTASGFLDVNLRAFMKILSTSWSYFALLRTIYSR